ncbi:MAG: porin, partial [Campylobacterales bacterium]|nr:porin [Campylobacterales bacterium]
GGMPAYTQGMVTRHQFMAGTKAAKIAGTYNFKEMGTNLSTTLYYASFDMDENSGYGIARTATEAGFDAIYYPEMVKNLQLRLRGNFPRKFAESASGDTGWNEYRFIVNYNF